MPKQVLDLTPRYIAGLFEPSIQSYSAIVKRSVFAIESCGIPYDTIIGTGLSGSLVVPEVGRTLGCYWSVIRKPNESSHHNELLAGSLGKLWVFLDDFSLSGATFDRVFDTIDTTCVFHGFDTEYSFSYYYLEEEITIDRTG